MNDPRDSNDLQHLARMLEFIHKGQFYIVVCLVAIEVTLVALLWAVS